MKKVMITWDGSRKANAKSIVMERRKDSYFESFDELEEVTCSVSQDVFVPTLMSGCETLVFLGMGRYKESNGNIQCLSKAQAKLQLMASQYMGPLRQDVF